jgi:hypothetical protein
MSRRQADFNVGPSAYRLSLLMQPTQRSLIARARRTIVPVHFRSSIPVGVDRIAILPNVLQKPNIPT